MISELSNTPYVILNRREQPTTQHNDLIDLLIEMDVFSPRNDTPRQSLLGRLYDQQLNRYHKTLNAADLRSILEQVREEWPTFVTAKEAEEKWATHLYKGTGVIFLVFAVAMPFFNRAIDAGGMLTIEFVCAVCIGIIFRKSRRTPQEAEADARKWKVPLLNLNKIVNFAEAHPIEVRLELQQWFTQYKRFVQPLLETV